MSGCSGVPGCRLALIPTICACFAATASTFGPPPPTIERRVRLLHRLRLTVEPVDLVVLAVERERLRTHQALDDGERLVEAGDAHARGIEIDAGPLVVGGHPPGAEPELEPAVAEHVDRRGLGREDDRDACSRCRARACRRAASRWPRPRSRDPGHRRERVVDEVVGHEERRVPERLDLPGVARRTRDAERGVLGDDAEPEPAGDAPSAARRSRSRTCPARSRRARRGPATRRTRPARSRAARSGRRGGSRRRSSGSVLTSSTLSSPRYCGSIRPGRVEHRHPVLQREPGAWQHEAAAARRDRDREPGRHERPATTRRDRRASSLAQRS